MIGEVMLDELDPSGRAGGDHREHPAVLHAVDKLGALLHDGEVGCKVHVKDVVEAHSAERRSHLALDLGADGAVEFLAETDPDRGAVPTMTYLEGSASAATTLSISDFSVKAPVGQTVIHCPQPTQATEERGFSKAQAMWVSKPRALAPMTATD